MFKSKTSMKVISLLVAIAIWLYVMGEVDPETRAKIGDIPVSFTNTEVLEGYGLAVACDEQITVSATISGKRSDVNEAKKNGLTASVDVAECEQGENTEKITVNLPDGISLENMSTSTMTVKVEEMVYEYKPVDIEFSGVEVSGEAVENTVPWVLDRYPSEITVMGAKSSVDKIDRLLGVIDPEEASTEKEKQVAVKLVPVNKKGREILNVSLYQDEAYATIRELTVANVGVVYTAEDENTDIDKLELPDKIRIAGSKDVIDDIKTIECIVSIKGSNVYVDAELPENVFIMIGEDNGKIIWN